MARYNIRFQEDLLKRMHEVAGGNTKQWLEDLVAAAIAHEKLANERAAEALRRATAFSHQSLVTTIADQQKQIEALTQRLDVLALRVELPVSAAFDAAKS